MFDLDAFPIDLSQVDSSKYFDADWYRTTYKDVDMVGLSPAKHFIKYGVSMRRDPGPDFSTGFFLDTHPGRAHTDPRRLIKALRGESKGMTPKENRVLGAVHNVALRGELDRAVQLAKEYLPGTLAHTVHVIHANAALNQGSEEKWLRHLNAYLDHYGLDPLYLAGEGSVFERFSTRELPPVENGPLISVIMPAWNAQETLPFATRSILNQTWRNLELLIVDDCSDDNTWNTLQEIAAKDHRVRIFRNKANVGPYVSKNIALTRSHGDWVTGHDADDWAHPQRLENHFNEAIKRNLKASITLMIRMKLNGAFSHFGTVSPFSRDAVARKASISCLFNRKFLEEKLGFWDTVRFGADSEMIARAELLLGDDFVVLPQISMFCLDLESSLTNHPDYGVRSSSGTMSPTRQTYRTAWGTWHQNADAGDLRFDIYGSGGRYDIPAEMSVSASDICVNINSV